MRSVLALAILFASTPTLWGAVFSFAQPVVTVGPDSSPLTATPTFTDNGDGTWSSTGTLSIPYWDFDWNVTVDPDPIISANFSMVNTTAVTQSYIVSVTLPILAQTPLTLVGGSVGLSLTDSNFNGFAQVTDIGTGIFQGQNDGVTVLELLNDPFALTANLFAGQTVTANDVGGLPGPSIVGPAATSTISIVHRFSLTAGDSVAFTSFYVVQAVPEMNTAVLVGGVMLLLGVVLRLRYRKNVA